MPIKCVILLISSNTWISLVNAFNCCVFIKPRKGDGRAGYCNKCFGSYLPPF